MNPFADPIPTPQIQQVQSVAMVGLNWGIILATIAALAALITLGLVVRQLGVMNRQLDVMNRQDSTMNRQLQILEAQIAARSSLELRTAVLHGYEDGRARLQLNVANTGKKSANGFYWHVYIPMGIRWAGGDFEHADIKALIPGGTSRVGQGFYKPPVFQTRAVQIAIMIIAPEVAGDFDIRWKIVGEDGVFPAEDQFGTTQVTITQLPPPVS